MSRVGFVRSSKLDSPQRGSGTRIGLIKCMTIHYSLNALSPANFYRPHYSTNQLTITSSHLRALFSEFCEEKERKPKADVSLCCNGETAECFTMHGYGAQL